MDPELRELLDRIAELTDDELADLEAQLVAAGNDVGATDTQEALDSLVEIDAALTRVRTEIGERAEAAEQRETQRAELLERINPPVVEQEPEGDPAEGDGEDDAGDGEGDGDPATPEATAEVEADADEDEETPAVPARQAARTRRRIPTAPRQNQRAPSRTTSTLRAAGDLPGFSAGSTIPDIDALNRAFVKKVSSARDKGKSGVGYYGIATIETDWPEDRVLTDDPSRNMQLIERVVGEEALTAAGGLCAPRNPRWELMGISIESRPVRDSLPGFRADRGGVSFIQPPKLADVASGVDVITEVEDSQSATKPCFTATCGTPVTCDVSAVSKCLTVGNFNARFWPEQKARFWQLLGAQHAREAEAELVSCMESSATLVTMGKVAGAARDVLENLAQAGAEYRSRNRMAEDATLRWLYPSWLVDMMAADLIRQAPGDNMLAITRAMIEAMIRARNIEPVSSIDYQVYGAQAAGALIPWQTAAVDSLLYHEGAYIFVDGGSLDFGMEIRDSSLNEANNVRAHAETFETCCFIGVEAVKLRMTLCPDGTSSAPIELDPCTLGS